ncbi:sulfotransferase [Aquibacillus albus]|uniref:Sulfotransferase n=1 Tax=Aquibacillus albus TaxID=1168171 RepID=A0ABS2MZR3_9BACI|nr:sulfotransferase [Aquibacillus albus]MBM7571384.1 hypothetical protein [Aquibacillus albus]
MDKTIFFIGEGRSGTTVIFEVFSRHKDIAYLSNYTDKFYFPQTGLIHRIIKKRGKKNQYNDVPILNKTFPKPSEAYDTWEKLCGSKIRYSFMRNIQPTQIEAESVIKYINQIKKYQGKKLFSTKFTGPPRISYFTQVFDNISFVNIVRDPRAVVASLMNVKFWKDKGDEPFWDGTFTEHEYEIWNRYDKSQVALAALEWNSIYKQTEIEKNISNCHVINIKYEDFMENPKKEMNSLLDYLNLDYCNSLQSHIEKVDNKNMNYKYKERLSEDQIKVVEEVCKDAMEKLGYL